MKIEVFIKHVWKVDSVGLAKFKYCLKNEK